METNNIVLEGKGLIQQVMHVQPLSNMKGYRDGQLFDKNNIPYHLLSYAGKAFIVRDDIFNLFKEGGLASLTLTKGVRIQEGIEQFNSEGVSLGVSEPATVESYTMTGYTTKEQHFGIIEQEAIEDAIRANAAKAVNLNVSGWRSLFANQSTVKPTVVQQTAHTTGDQANSTAKTADATATKEQIANPLEEGISADATANAAQ